MPLLRRACLLLLGGLLVALPGTATAQSHTLRSDHLEITVTEDPYRFEVRAAGSGEVLLSHAGTTFRQGVLPQRVTEAYDVEVYDGIGSAEMFHIYTTNRPGDIQPASLGREVDGYEVRLLPMGADGPGAEEVDQGETGEMWVKGDSVAHGYYRKRESSWETFHGHWCRTGDLFRRDEEGYLYLEGRAGNLFKASGIWVAPKEVEDCLAEHEAVSNACVIPAEKEDGLVKPKAFVVVREGHRGRVADDAKAGELRGELQEHVKSTISKHKYPRWVIFTDELPRNDRGKVNSKELIRREEAGENPWA